MCTPSANKQPSVASDSAAFDSNQLKQPVVSCSAVFDTKRKVLHQDYKFTTADLSQVCDGRNWELARHAAPGTASAAAKNKARARAAANKAKESSTDAAAIEKDGAVGKVEPKVASNVEAVSTTKEESSVDAGATDHVKNSNTNSKDQLKSRINARYKPVSARSLRSSATCVGSHPSIPEEKKQEDDPALQTSEQQQQFNEESLGELLASLARESPPGTLCREVSDVTIDSNATICPPPANPSTKNQSKMRRRSSSSKGSSSSDRSSRRSSPKQDKEASRRRSTGTTSQRSRSSSSSKQSDGERQERDQVQNQKNHQRSSSSSSSKKSKPRRRLSVDSNTTSSSTLSGRRSTVRKLSEPMHRCSITNDNVSGIMRPSRYSSNNLAAMANPTTTTATTTTTTTPVSTPPPVRRTSPPVESAKKVWDEFHNARRRHSSAGGPTDDNSSSSSPSVVRSNNSNSKVTSSFSCFGGLSSELGAAAAASIAAQRPHSAQNLAGFGSKGKMECDDALPEDMGNAHWVASGVEFSKSMEVYLFKT